MWVLVPFVILVRDWSVAGDFMYLFVFFLLWIFQYSPVLDQRSHAILVFICFNCVYMINIHLCKIVIVHWMYTFSSFFIWRINQRCTKYIIKQSMCWKTVLFISSTLPLSIEKINWIIFTTDLNPLIKNINNFKLIDSFMLKVTHDSISYAEACGLLFS